MLIYVFIGLGYEQSTNLKGMVYFYRKDSRIFAVQSEQLYAREHGVISHILGDAEPVKARKIEGFFLGKRIQMISPWSTNVVDIIRNTGITSVIRVEEYQSWERGNKDYDPMLEMTFDGLDESLFEVRAEPEPIRYIDDIEAYNKKEGLALSSDEVNYLKEVSEQLGRPLTDSEVFGFSQVNSEHCRHKIFNGTFIVDGKVMPDSLFALIKKTTQKHPNTVVSAYKDNVAFMEGPVVELLAPARYDAPAPYRKRDIQTVISLKAETHNFPTTVEAFNGAATGSGGEIRDRMAGGKAGIPLAGTAVYMTPYARLGTTAESRPWERIPERNWLYQHPADILIKASDGASDFGNKFGQPLICGSLLTFEWNEGDKYIAYDKVIMLAGGVGYAKREDALKDEPTPGDIISVSGGDNYRIGMGGASVSSSDTGQEETHLELNAVQRSNPEMQKRVANLIRALAESGVNPIISIHDHGAGGHLNCLTELVENEGGIIDIDKLPLGDPSLSFKEILGNESQERMGMIISGKDRELILRIAQRERAPFYEVGKVSGDGRFVVRSGKTGEKPVDMSLMQLFGNTPVMQMRGATIPYQGDRIEYNMESVPEYVRLLLRLEAVACKDWLTNKVDRCVSGRVAKQQTCGSIQLPLNNVGVVALDYNGKHGIATSIGHAPAAGLVNPEAASRLAVVEALTNIVWAPLQQGLKAVSLSANWMWPTGSEEENARLYKAVQALSDFVMELEINVPTGKDSLSMTQRYPDKEVSAPGTLIISASAHCDDITRTVEPVLKDTGSKALYYMDFSHSPYALGGSSFAQIFNKKGESAPDVRDAKRIAVKFNALQEAIRAGYVLAGHDIGSGGMITSLLEMCFPQTNLGADIDLSTLSGKDAVHILFAENPGVIFQAVPEVEEFLTRKGVNFFRIGEVKHNGKLDIQTREDRWSFDIETYRDIWYETSYLLDAKQSGEAKARERYEQYKNQVLQYSFAPDFDGHIHLLESQVKPVAGVLREQGSNSEREMANALYLAGFEVMDIHMSDLIEGREDLSGVDFLVAVGGFSYSDVLGSAKGWASSILYNENARRAWESFYRREDTLSLGVCNGCQLFVELGVLTPGHEVKPKMLHNDSGKFECIFTTVRIEENHTVMLANMAGQQLGIWAAHGEGKFSLPLDEKAYHIPGKYGYASYPANPNGSDYNAAMLASADGRHLAMMPHLERSIFPWNWAYYPDDREDEVSPWIQAFINARKWLLKNKYDQS